MKNFTHSFRLLTLLAALFVMSASAMGATKSEDFEKATATGSSYKDITFDALEAGVTWAGTQVRTDDKIGGAKGIMLKKDAASKLTSSPISGGIKNLTFKYKQAFGSKANFNVVIGAQTYGPYVTSTQSTVETATINDINLSGDFTIGFVQINSSSAQVVIDDLSWETYGSATTPTASFVGSGDFGSIETGNTVDKTIIVKGSNLTGNLTVAVSGPGFSTTKTTLLESELESEAGSELPVKFIASAAGAHEGTITITGGGLTEGKTLSLSANVYQVTEVSTLADVLANDKGEAIYEITGDVLIHFMNGVNVYLHDASAQTLLYNGGNVIDGSLIATGHKIKGLKVKVDLYFNVKQLVPVALGTVSSTGNLLPEPAVTTVEDLVTNPMNFVHKFVIVHNVKMEQKPFTPSDLNNVVTGEGGVATLTCYDKYKVLDGFTPSAEKLSVAGIVSIFKENAQIQPRSTKDIFTTVSKPSLDATNTKVYATTGRVIVETEAAARVEIFNTVGQAVKVVTVDGTATINLNKGLYIVRVNGKAVKVLVR